MDGYRRAFFNGGVDELETSLKRVSVSRPNGRYQPPPQLNFSNARDTCQEKEHNTRTFCSNYFNNK